MKFVRLRLGLAWLLVIGITLQAQAATIQLYCTYKTVTHPNTDKGGAVTVDVTNQRILTFNGFLNCHYNYVGQDGWCHANITPTEITWKWGNMGGASSINRVTGAATWVITGSGQLYAYGTCSAQAPANTKF
ncbi:MAG: hypothetical protein KGJ66_09490 [Alphaproteobacteria bacterium]|nr:hypothetical protein [Alphaproteobacteria bacterium]